MATTDVAVRAARRVLAGRTQRGLTNPATGRKFELTEEQAARVVKEKTGRWPRGWAKANPKGDPSLGSLRRKYRERIELADGDIGVVGMALQGVAFKELNKRKRERMWHDGMALQRYAGLAPPRKGNPESSASIDSARLYHEFHGVESTETVEVRTPIKSRTDLAELGTLTEIRVVTVSGKRRFEIPFPDDGPDSVMLCSSPDGYQLYFEAGDQSLDLGQLKMADSKWLRDQMAIGVLCQVTYRAEKGFDKFELTDYWHKLGEDTGVQPWLVYDQLNGLLYVYGGQYEVRSEGIVN